MIDAIEHTILLRTRNRVLVLRTRVQMKETTMHVHKARERLRWRGAETVREIAKRLSRREQTVVLLPHGLHHAVCVRIGADERLHDRVDVTLDPDTFERLTRITALRELDALSEQVKRAGIIVRVRTPPAELLFVAREVALIGNVHKHHSGALATVTTVT
jgi:hypothetical protein